MENIPVYDRWGRMKYNHEHHPNQGKPWTTKDESYLIAFYEKIGPEQMSMALGRTITTIQQRACDLRKKKLMPKRTSKTKHCRIRDAQQRAGV